MISVINVASCLYLGYIGMTSNEKLSFSDSIVNVNTNQDTTGSSPVVRAAYDKNIETAKLDINIGATTLVLDSVPAADLLYAATSNTNMGLVLTRSGEKESPYLEISNVTKKESKKNHLITFALNENPIWTIDINMGAATFNADFSKYKLAKLEINAGAASMNLKFGMPHLENNEINVNTGASSFVLNIPKDAACRVEMNTFLSSKKLEGFEKVDEYFQTPNYESADKKYHINIAGAANSLKINRY